MSDKRPAGVWPKAIVGLIFFFLVLTGWSIHRAVTGVSAVTNPQYYSHGLKYNRTLVEKEAAAALGWEFETSLRNGRLCIRLHDGNGQEISGVQARLTLFGGGRDHERLLELKESSPGSYSAELPPRNESQVPARLSLRRDGASMSRSLLLYL